MKKILSIISISLLALATASAQSDDVYYSNNNDAYAYSSNDYNNDNSYSNSTQDYSYQTFYDDLAPYGSWVSYPGYGQVWVPANMDADFSPYLTGGHWVYSDYGWTWVSDYNWGWAAFHYGRWFHDVSFGWMWMPGNEWAPAWVTWGSYSNNYCWAPIAPGYGFSAQYRPDAHYWNFVPCGNINQSHLTNYVVNHNVNVWTVNNNITVINNVNTYNNIKYASGPRVNDVERASGRSIAKVNVTKASRPSDSRLRGNDLQIYRPAINTAAHIDRNAQSRTSINADRADMQGHKADMRATAYSPSARSNSQTASNYSRADQVQPFQRTENRATAQQFSQPRNISRPDFQNQPVQRTENRPAPQQFSEPRNVSRPDFQNQPVQRTENRPAPQQFSQPRNISRPDFQSQPVQRTENRPAPQQFSQPQNVSRPSYQNQAIQRTENRPAPQQAAQAPRGMRIH